MRTFKIIAIIWENAMWIQSDKIYRVVIIKSPHTHFPRKYNFLMLKKKKYYAVKWKTSFHKIVESLGANPISLIRSMMNELTVIKNCTKKKTFSSSFKMHQIVWYLTHGNSPPCLEEWVRWWLEVVLSL